MQEVENTENWIRMFAATDGGNQVRTAAETTDESPWVLPSSCATYGPLAGWPLDLSGKSMPQTCGWLEHP
jgi:hypothetical protein